MRWRMLAVLFAARMAMAFQFQAVAALSGAYQDGYGVGLDNLGFLIGLYLSPGIVIAFPSGVIGSWLGGKRGVGLGLALMTLGAVLALLAGNWSTEVTARLLAGTGGVLLNVLMTKMVTDWFAKKDIATAMGLFVNSWPVGIALALVTLPAFHARFGMFGADVCVLVVCTMALAIFMLSYRNPPDLVEAHAGPLFGPPGGLRPVIGAVLSGLIWGGMNAGLAISFSFGSPLLAEFGFDATGAAARTSLILWALAVTTPLGGIIADRSGRYDLVIAVSILGFAGAMALAASGAASLTAFVIAGACAGLCAGPIMSLPSGALPTHWRAQGMGLFFTTYYVVMLIAPPLAGVAAETTGTLAASFSVGAGFILFCLPCLVALRRFRVQAT